MEKRTKQVRGGAADAGEGRALVRSLCAWYAREARDLPWRGLGDPYAIWICETMCQQTRIETVIPYWERFLAELPDPAALAEVCEERLMALWSGLGYYSRARRLQEAARVIVAKHGGRLPGSAEALRELPGIGPYTAGAVASIAFGERAPLVDGNVARVLCRLDGFEAPLGSAESKRVLDRRTAELIAHTTSGRFGPGRWNQALMELGALVCTPRQPACLICPVNERCHARASGDPARLPIPAPKPEPIEVRLEVFWIQRDDRILLTKRPATGRMAGLLELPTRERGAGAGGRVHLWPAALPIAGLRAAGELGEVSHAITRHRIRAKVALGALAPGTLAKPKAPFEWVQLDAWRDLPLTGLARKILGRDFGAGGRGQGRGRRVGFDEPRP